MLSSVHLYHQTDYTKGYEVSGYPRDLPKSGFMDHVHPDDLERCIETWSNAAHEPQRLEFRWKRGPEDTFDRVSVDVHATDMQLAKPNCSQWSLSQSVVEHNADGSLRGIVGVISSK